MSKSPDAFRTISEVADWLGVQAHVLRFWESKFSQIKPVKRAGGRRYYRPADMLLLGGIKKLLHDDGMTIKGVQKVLREQGVAEVSSLSPELTTEGETVTGEVVDNTVVQFRTQEPAETTPELPDAEVPLRDVPVDDAVTSEPPLDASFGRQDDAPDIVPEDSTPEPEIVNDSAETEPEFPEPKQPELAAEQDDFDDALSASEQKEIDAQNATLPSFLHRRAEPPVSEPVPEAEAEPDPEPELTSPEPEPIADAAPRTRIIDAPDPPSEEDIDVSPGLLASTAALTHLTPQQAEAFMPLIQKLRELTGRPGQSNPN